MLKLVKIEPNNLDYKAPNWGDSQKGGKYE